MTWADLGVRPSLSDGAVKVIVDSPGTQAAVGVVVHGVGVLPLHVLQGNTQLWINQSIKQCFTLCLFTARWYHTSCSPPPPPPHRHTQKKLFQKNHISVSYTNLATGLWAISLTTKVLTSVVYKISYSCRGWSESDKNRNDCTYIRNQHNDEKFTFWKILHYDRDDWGSSGSHRSALLWGARGIHQRSRGSTVECCTGSQGSTMVSQGSRSAMVSQGSRSAMVSQGSGSAKVSQGSRVSTPVGSHTICTDLIGGEERHMEGSAPVNGQPRTCHLHPPVGTPSTININNNNTSNT